MFTLTGIAVVDRLPLSVRAVHATTTLVRGPLAAVLALVAVAPFERPWLTVGALTITTVEAAMIAAIAVVLVARLAAGQVLSWQMPLMRPGVAFLAVLAIAALVAPIESGNALRFVARMGAGACLFIVAATVIDTDRRARLVIVTLLASASVVAAIAVLEAAQVPAVMSALTIFRPGFHVVGGQLRATSTLFYPTIASMYLEIAFACGLWLLLDPRSSRPRIERTVVFIALALVGAGIIATFTRAGLLAMAAALAVVAALQMSRRPWRAAGVRSLALLAAVVTAMVLLSRSTEYLVTRLRTEGSQAWYGARYDVPPALRLSTAATSVVPITLTNTGRLTWDSRREPAFAMSYHWLRADGEAVIQFDGDRTSFSHPVAPGTSVRLPVQVTAPGVAGDYVLVWDVVHETRAWLSTEGVAPARTRVRVDGAPRGEVRTTLARLPDAPLRPSRPVLWTAALTMAAERPLAGVGPDNFRHVYGRYAGLPRWDERVHANNMYLEVLAGSGVPGLIALVWLLGAAGRTLWRRWQASGDAAATAAAALLAAWVAIAGHGLVDSFLSFTTTYVLFAIVAGVALSRGLEPPAAAAAGVATDAPSAHARALRRDDAHRV